MVLKIKRFFLFFLVCFVFVNFASSQPIWQRDHFEIFLQNNAIKLFHEKTKFLEIQSIEFNFIKPDTILVEEVKENTVILKLLFTEDDGFSRNFPPEVIVTISQSNNTFHFYANPEDIRHVTITMKDLDEHYFGLIEKLYPDNSKIYN